MIFKFKSPVGELIVSLDRVNRKLKLYPMFSDSRINADLSKFTYDELFKKHTVSKKLDDVVFSPLGMNLNDIVEEDTIDLSDKDFAKLIILSFETLGMKLITHKVSDK